MIKKFITWFIVFGLSFLIEWFGWTSQGNAFMWLHLGFWGVIVAILAIISLFGGTKAIAISGILVFFTALSLGIILFATWGATQLFGVEFTVAYQIMTFGECLSVNSKDDD